MGTLAAGGRGSVGACHAGTVSPEPSPDAAVAAYRERLWPGPLGWLCVLGLAAFGLLALTPVGLGAAAAGALVCGGAAGLAAVATAAPVVVRDGELHVGRAHIPVALLGDAEVLDRAGVRVALGPGSDARTFACVRPWISGALRLAVVDPVDPTPAWLVSSRRPESLLAAVRAAAAPGQAAHSVQTI